MDKDRSGFAFTPSDWSGLQLTSVSPSVISPCMAPGLVSSTYTSTPEALQIYEIGIVVVDGWAVTFGTARRRLGGAAARPSGPSSLYQMCGVNSFKTLRLRLYTLSPSETLRRVGGNCYASVVNALSRRCCSLYAE